MVSSLQAVESNQTDEGAVGTMAQLGPSQQLGISIPQMYPKFVRLPSVADAEPLALTGDSYRWHSLQPLLLSLWSGEGAQCLQCIEEHATRPV